MGRTAIVPTLLERGEERRELDDRLVAAGQGSGGVVLVEGPAGIGKSSLLDACANDAERCGVTALKVRGDELLMASSFAAVRELFWPLVRQDGTAALDGAARLAIPVLEGEPAAEDDRDRASSVLHGLYWLTADLAERGPLALFVDDAQWLDAASARFFLYLSRRIDAVAVLLVIALRSGERSGYGQLGIGLAEQGAAIVRPAPLSEDASALLVRELLGPRADEELCQSCYEATRGNPFYLRELSAALRAEGGRPTAELARRVRALGAGTIVASVLVRLARLGSECERMAYAVAVLGPGASLRHAGAVASLDRERAASAADQLRSAELLSPGPALSFLHPIVNEAISSQLPPARRASLHAQAARLLAADGASSDRVAAHLLSAEPYGESWVVDALRAAAHEVRARGAPEAAVSYLRRALAEPPREEARLDVLVELGRAEALLPGAHDFSALREALTLARGPRRRANIALELALALFGVLRNAEAVAVLDDALRDADRLDGASVQVLEQALIGGGVGDLDASPRLLARAERYFERARSGEVRDPRMLATLAGAATWSGRSAAEAARLARQALQDDQLLVKWLDDGYVTAAQALYESGHPHEAAVALEAGIAEAQRRGSAPMLLQLSLMRADTALRTGDLDVAEDYAGRSYDLGRELGSERTGAVWLPVVLLERARPDAAAALLEPLELDPVADQFDTILLVNRGRVRIARGETDAGLRDLLDADRRWAGAGLSLSVPTDWVATAVLALTRLGRVPEAKSLAARELEEAGAYGEPRRRGIALSAYGSVEPSGQGLTCLRQAIEILESSGARLEQARAFVNLGVGLRERGHTGPAREALARGLDIAHGCGGWALAERARSELVASGARPRRDALRGPGALTPAELRVARMAAGGLTNRAIAQALFVTTKTVETQLSSVYAKLTISSRAELSGALSGVQRRVAPLTPGP